MSGSATDDPGSGHFWVELSASVHDPEVSDWQARLVLGKSHLLVLDLCRDPNGSRHRSQSE